VSVESEGDQPLVFTKRAIAAAVSKAPCFEFGTKPVDFDVSAPPPPIASSRNPRLPSQKQAPRGAAGGGIRWAASLGQRGGCPLLKNTPGLRPVAIF